jgi:hypothetical protein
MANPDEDTPDGTAGEDDRPRPSNPPVGPSSPPRQDPRE